MLMQNYKRYDVTFIKGKGNYLYDNNDKKYLDMGSGIGVNSIGYAHPKWIKAVSEQAKKLAHTSNLFHNKPAQKLAEKIAKISGLHSVFFANSGAEANEALIKLARKYSFDKYGEHRYKIATLKSSFHGRTISTLSATGQDKFHKYFNPFTEGFYYIPTTGEVQLEKDTCAILIEIIQGEGGINVLEKEFLLNIQKQCKENDILFLIDEVQTGFGRTGEWFAFQNYGLKPDAISFAKGIGGGLPIGGIVVSEKLKDVLSIGMHGTTFGGNPICCNAAIATIGIIEELLSFVKEKGEKISEILKSKFGNSRGIGLMLGTTIDGDIDDLVKQLLDLGIVALTANNSTLRLLPPLTLKEEEIEEFDIALNKI